MTLTVERDIDDLRAGLQRWLGRPVGDITRPAPGWSCETLIVERDFVVRLPPAGAGIFPEYHLAQQAAVQQAAGRAGVPVAAPLRYEADPSFLGAPFIAMAFIAGPVPSDFTPSDAWLGALPDDASRRRVWRSFVDTVVTIHTVAPDGLGLRTGLDAELAYWHDYVAWACDGSPPGPLADALCWCTDHRAADEPAPGLLWGDVRLGNVVYDEDALAPKAVLDWDMASAGPAEMDVAWFLALESVQAELTHMSVPGFGSRSDAVATVERGLGRVLVDLDWYEVFALVRASAISTRIAILFERAGRPSMFKVGDDPTLAAAIRRIDAW